MKTTLFDETVPVFIRFLTNLSKILDKAAKKRGLTGKKIVSARLAPDMYTLTQQVGYAYFMTLEVAGNLAGKQAPAFTYDEKSVAELRSSIKRAVTFLKTIRPKDFIKKRAVKTFLNPNKKFSDVAYVRELALPNFFFHVVTAYGILRHLGVPLGKDDYLGL